MIEQVFTPGWGSEFSVTNATSATAAVNLPATCREVALTNTSATATVHVFVTNYDGVTAPAGTAPTLTTGLPILPSQQIRVGVGVGNKVIRTIATAANGTLMVNPGNGG
jgi:hypothetical protein